MAVQQQALQLLLDHCLCWRQLALVSVLRKQQQHL
jgi:hypothetical protein